MVKQRTVIAGFASVVGGNKHVGPRNRVDKFVLSEKFLPRSRLIVSWDQDFCPAVLQNRDDTMVV